MSNFDGFLSRFQNAKKVGNGFLVKCPGHKDEKNSLSVTPSGDTVLMNCHAGCKTETEILPAIGLTAKDLYFDNGNDYRPEPKPVIKKVYPYHNDNGEEVYQNVRYEPKDFKQRRPNGNGGWIWGLGDIPRVPYRLPELLKQAKKKPGGFVLLAEGEEDSDNLKAKGFVASSLKNWKSEFSQYIKNQNVVISVDHDKSGLNQAQNTADRLIGTVKAVKIVDLYKDEPLPDKHGKDVSDWLGKGHTKDELIEIIRKTPEFKKGENIANNGTEDEESPRTNKSNQSQQLVQIAEGSALFHTPEGIAYSEIEIEDHVENYPVRSRAFREWLGLQFYNREKKAASGQVIREAVDTISAKAKYQSEAHDVHLRIAEKDGNIYIDLCNKDWQIVEVNKKDWRLIDSADSPVKFRRSPSMTALPTPAKKGDISLLKKYLNVSDDSFILVKAWLAAALRPGYPYPILMFNGEKGTAKSTASRVVKMLSDPNKVLSKSLSRNARDLYIGAFNVHVNSFDNISYISPEISDEICSLATGGGFTTRKLFADDEETTFTFKRPIILNGIGTITGRTDLLDRALVVNLEYISPAERIAERKFYEEFENDSAAIFAGVLDALVDGVKLIDQTELDGSPRMADFAQWSVACEFGLGIEKGEFLKLYDSNQENINLTLLEDSILAQELFKMRDRSGNADEVFTGTVGDLLAAITEHTDTKTTERKDFPKTPRALRGKIDRINPNLREVGIEIKFGKRSKRGTRVSVKSVKTVTPEPRGKEAELAKNSDPPIYSRKRPSPHTPEDPKSPETLLNQAKKGDGLGDGRGDGLKIEKQHTPQHTPETESVSGSKNNDLEKKGVCGDGGDGQMHINNEDDREVMEF